MLIINNFGNINIIGFSLTGYGNEGSIGKLLEARLQRDSGWQGCLREISYGGLAIDSLSGLLAGACGSVQAGDLVLLEIATSYYSLHGHSLDQARPFVLSMANYLARRQDCLVAFMNLYRQDLQDKDCVVQAIEEASAAFGIPVIDLKTCFRDGRLQGRFIAPDGVHPDLATRELLAQETAVALSALQLALPLEPRRDLPSYHYLDLVPLLPEYERFRYAGRGKELEAAVLPANTTIEVDLGLEYDIIGTCFLFGPETGFLQVTPEGQGMRELPTFDANSYYRRIGFRATELSTRKLTISVPEKRRKIALVRESNLPAASRCEFVCGLVVRSGKADLF